MPTGTPRIVAGIILIVVLGLFALRGLLVLVLGSLTGVDGAYLVGSLLGVIIVTALLVLVILRVLSRGLAQRRAYLATQQGTGQPTF